MKDFWIRQGYCLCLGIAILAVKFISNAVIGGLVIGFCIALSYDFIQLKKEKR